MGSGESGRASPEPTRQSEAVRVALGFWYWRLRPDNLATATVSVITPGKMGRRKGRLTRHRLERLEPPKSEGNADVRACEAQTTGWAELARTYLQAGSLWASGPVDKDGR